MKNLLKILIKYVHGPLLSVTKMSNYIKAATMSNPGQNIIIRDVIDSCFIFWIAYGVWSMYVCMYVCNQEN